MYNPLRRYITPESLPKDCDIRDLPSRGWWPFLWFFARQIKWPLLAIGSLQAFSSVLEAMGPYYIKIMVDAFQTNTNPNAIWGEFGWALVLFIILYLILQPVTARIVISWVAEIRPSFNRMMNRQLSLYVYEHR